MTRPFSPIQNREHIRFRSMDHLPMRCARRRGTIGGALTSFVDATEPRMKTPRGAPGYFLVAPTGVNVQSMCLIPLMKGESRRSGSPVA